LTNVLPETKRLLYSKGNSHKTEETAHRMGEIFARYTSNKELITRMYLEPKKLNSQRINDPIKKWTNELNKAFSTEEVQMDKKQKRNT
jgi:protocatechuate 3,4-dioxygenase beta subunit